MGGIQCVSNWPAPRSRLRWPPGPRFAQSGEITIWSWNIAASSLKATVAGFNKQFPDVKVTVEDLGNQPVYDKSIAGCAAGGEGLPDIVSIENGEAENYWSQFPDCFVDLQTLGYTAEDQAKFPDFKRTELEVGDKAYAMPWDSGPVAMFYRRDFYEKAGVDPAIDQDLGRFHRRRQEDPGSQSRRDDDQRRLQRRQRILPHDLQRAGLRLFRHRRPVDHGQPAEMRRRPDQDQGDEGRRHHLRRPTGTTKITNNTAGKVATQMYGGWYEGTVRTESPDGSGKWGVYLMPSLTADGPRAANLGGSSLAITSASKNKEAAYAYLNYTLGDQ